MAGGFPPGDDLVYSPTPLTGGSEAESHVQEEETMSLRELILKEGASLAEVATYLDGLAPDARLKEVMGLAKKHQRVLWQLAETAAPLTLEDFVPNDTPPLAPVVHEGRNTLPLFRRFQKVMCRPSDGTRRLFGYNEGSTRWLIGPGYFVLRDTSDLPEWHGKASLVVDYFQVPDGPVAEGWPNVIPNEKGLQKFVYKGTRDFMRRVSETVTIGEAWRGDTPLNNWFMLVRS